MPPRMAELVFLRRFGQAIGSSLKDIGAADRRRCPKRPENLAIGWEIQACLRLCSGLPDNCSFRRIAFHQDLQ